MDETETYAGSYYTEYMTEQGIFRIYHEMTLGDLAIFTALAVLLLVIVLKMLFEKIWED